MCGFRFLKTVSRINCENTKWALPSYSKIRNRVNQVGLVVSPPESVHLLIFCGRVESHKSMPTLLPLAPQTLPCALYRMFVGLISPNNRSHAQDRPQFLSAGGYWLTLLSAAAEPGSHCCPPGPRGWQSPTPVNNGCDTSSSPRPKMVTRLLLTNRAGTVRLTLGAATTTRVSRPTYQSEERCSWRRLARGRTAGLTRRGDHPVAWIACSLVPFPTFRRARTDARTPAWPALPGVATSPTVPARMPRSAWRPRDPAAAATPGACPLDGGYRSGMIPGPGRPELRRRVTCCVQVLVGARRHRARAPMSRSVLGHPSFGPGGLGG